MWAFQLSNGWGGGGDCRIGVIQQALLLMSLLSICMSLPLRALAVPSTLRSSVLTLSGIVCFAQRQHGDLVAPDQLVFSLPPVRLLGPVAVNGLLKCEP